MSCFQDNSIEPFATGQRELDADLQRLAGYLDDCRQRRKTVTYLEVATAIDVTPPHRIHQLTELLEALMEHDQENQQPLRAALVVSRTRTGLPAEGFFIKAQALDLMLNVTAEEFHQQCLDDLFADPARSKNLE